MCRDGCAGITERLFVPYISRAGEGSTFWLEIAAPAVEAVPVLPVHGRGTRDPQDRVLEHSLTYALIEIGAGVTYTDAMPRIAALYPDLGELFRLEGKYDDSAAQFREYLRLVPDTPQHQRNIQRAQGYVAQFGD